MVVERIFLLALSTLTTSMAWIPKQQQPKESLNSLSLNSLLSPLEFKGHQINLG
jgi:hypothetical protein